MKKTQIVVPCYNESKRINAKAFLDTLKNDSQLSFLFVNDGSTDDTLDILKYIKENNSAQVEILNLENNSGKAEAVRRGMLKSLEGTFDYIGYWDADLATPLSDIQILCNLLESKNADIVMGSRVRLLGHNIERKAARYYLGRIFAICSSQLLNIKIYDTQCGAKIFRKSEHLTAVFKKPFKVKWIFDVEMFARFSMVTGKSLTEISSKWIEYPLEKWLEVKGSNIKPKYFIRGGYEFITLCLYLQTPARKIYEKYVLGL